MTKLMSNKPVAILCAVSIVFFQVTSIGAAEADNHLALARSVSAQLPSVSVSQPGPVKPALNRSQESSMKLTSTDFLGTSRTLSLPLPEPTLPVNTQQVLKLDRIQPSAGSQSVYGPVPNPGSGEPLTMGPPAGYSDVTPVLQGMQSPLNPAGGISSPGVRAAGNSGNLFPGARLLLPSESVTLPGGLLVPYMELGVTALPEPELAPSGDTPALNEKPHQIPDVVMSSVVPSPGGHVATLIEQAKILELETIRLALLKPAPATDLLIRGRISQPAVVAGMGLRKRSSFR